MNENFSTATIGRRRRKINCDWRESFDMLGPQKRFCPFVIWRLLSWTHLVGLFYSLSRMNLSLLFTRELYLLGPAS